MKQKGMLDFSERDNCTAFITGLISGMEKSGCVSPLDAIHTLAYLVEEGSKSMQWKTASADCDAAKYAMMQICKEAVEEDPDEEDLGVVDYGALAPVPEVPVSVTAPASGTIVEKKPMDRIDMLSAPSAGVVDVNNAVSNSGTKKIEERKADIGRVMSSNASPDIKDSFITGLAMNAIASRDYRTAIDILGEVPMEDRERLVAPLKSFLSPQYHPLLEIYTAKDGTGSVNMQKMYEFVNDPARAVLAAKDKKGNSLMAQTATDTIMNTARESWDKIKDSPWINDVSPIAVGALGGFIAPRLFGVSATGTPFGDMLMGSALMYGGKTVADSVKTKGGKSTYWNDMKGNLLQYVMGNTNVNPLK